MEICINTEICKKMCMVVQAFEKLYNQTRLRVIWFTLYLAGRPIDSE